MQDHKAAGIAARGGREASGQTRMRGHGAQAMVRFGRLRQEGSITGFF